MRNKYATLYNVKVHLIKYPQDKMEIFNVTCYLSNLKMMLLGTEVVTSDDGKSIVKIPLNIAGYEIELWQDYDLMNRKPQELQGKFICSTELHIKEVPRDKIDEIISIVHELASLFSFATDSKVEFYKLYAEGMRPKSLPVAGTCSNLEPIFREHTEIKKFIENCWPCYNQLKEIRKLHVVIDLLVSIDEFPLYQEIKLATIFITIENLKYTYAKDKGYFFDNFFYRDDSKKERLGFEKLLIEMFQDCSMTPDLSNVITLRNDIIHSCLSSMSFEEQGRILSLCKELVKEYFLRLIGYSGDYCSSKGGRVKI